MIAPQNLLAASLAALAALGPAAAQDRLSLAFEDHTANSGVDHQGMSFGVTTGDFDGDGDVDLFLTRHYRWMRAALYLNQGDGTFQDASNRIFADPQDARTGDRHTATFVDLDGDRQRELLVTRGANRGQGSRANRFYEMSQGTLVDRATARGLGVALARARTGAFLDIDLDGDLDHVLATAARADGNSTNVVLFQDANGTFHAAAQPLLPTETAEGLVVSVLPGHGQVVFLNTRAPRIFDLSGAGISELTAATGLKADGHQNDLVVADFSGDGEVDVLSVRGRDGSDFQVTGDSTVEFSLVASGDSDELLLIPSTRNSTLRVRLFTHLGVGAVKIGPNRRSPVNLDFTLSTNDPAHVGGLQYDAGNEQGIFVTFDPIPQAWRLAVSTPDWLQIDGVLETTAPFVDVGHRNFDRSGGRMEPRLYTWEPDNGFVDTTDEAGLEIGLQARSVVSGDFDNDGDLDAYVVQSSSLRNLPNLLLENLGGGRFLTRRDAAGAAGSDAGRGDSVAVADIDNDGRLDLVVTNGAGSLPFAAGPDQVFRNVGGFDAAGDRNHWLMLDLVGTRSNPEAIGAKVVLEAGPLRQVRICDGGVHTYAQNDRRLHFGLADRTRVETVTIHWPSGQVQRLRDVAADQILTVVEP